MGARTTWKKTALGLSAAPLAAAMLLGSAGAASAVTDTPVDYYTNFDGVTGSPADLDGWKVWVGGYDWSVDEGAFRFSNQVWDGNILQLTSPAIAPAGEPGSGATNDVFAASFTVESATGGLQPGLNVEVDVDKTGSRAGGGVNLRHTDAGLEIAVRYPVYGGDAEMAAWRTSSVTVPADESHEIYYEVRFVEGGADPVYVWVDNELALTGLSWEGYHDAVPSAKQSVDSLLFRTSKTKPSATGIGYDVVEPTVDQAAALHGEGFLFDDVWYTSWKHTALVAGEFQPEATPEAATEGVTMTSTASTTNTKPGSSITVDADGFAPFEDVFVTFYSTPQTVAVLTADASGHVSGSVTVPANLAAGAHTLQLNGSMSGYVATSAFAVASAAALASTGFDGTPYAIGGGIVVLLGAGALFFARRNRKAAER